MREEGGHLVTAWHVCKHWSSVLLRTAQGGGEIPALSGKKIKPWCKDAVKRSYLSAFQHRWQPQICVFSSTLGMECLILLRQVQCLNEHPTNMASPTVHALFVKNADNTNAPMLRTQNIAACGARVRRAVTNREKSRLGYGFPTSVMLMALLCFN